VPLENLKITYGGVCLVTKQRVPAVPPEGYSTPGTPALGYCSLLGMLGLGDVASRPLSRHLSHSSQPLLRGVQPRGGTKHMHHGPSKLVLCYNRYPASTTTPSQRPPKSTETPPKLLKTRTFQQRITQPS
jgi:hypothetical protein